MLTLVDCANTGRLQGNRSGSSVSINGDTFNFYGDMITGLVNSVEISSHNDTKTGSSPTMYGGATTSDEAGSSTGGGMFLTGVTNSDVTASNFTVYGGTVSNNTAGTSNSGDGGVYVGEQCSFATDDDTITGNTITKGSGGGIHAHFSTDNVPISNVTITGNKASVTENISYSHRGDIYSEREVTIKDVKITGNSSTFVSGGIYRNGTIVLIDAIATGNN